MARLRIDNIGKFDIDVLAALHVILSEQSVGRAALIFGLSQPAMSNTLARVRTAFDDPLLVRTHGKMELTSRGQSLLQQLELILPQLERLAQPSEFEPARTSQAFHVGATDHAVQVLAPPLVAEVSERAPHCSLTISTVSSKEIAEELGGDDYDLRLGWFIAPPASWFIRRLINDTMVVVAGRANASISDRITREEFVAARQIGIRVRQPSHQTAMDKILTDQGAQRNVAVWMSNFSCIPHMVANSDLIALVPASLAQRYKAHEDLKVLEAPVELQPFSVSMAWSPRVHHDPANRWLRSMAVRSARGYLGSIQEQAAGPD